MKKGQEIGLKDANGEEIKIGDYLSVKTWWDTIEDTHEEDVIVKVIWEDYAVQLEKVENKTKKFMSVYCKKPQELKIMRF